jgi:hypothetical protein
MGLVIWMVFEAVTPKEEGLKSLKDHIEKLEEEPDCEVLETEYDEASEIENPHPGLDKGYSQVCETRVEIEGFDKAIEIMISYGPTYIQLEEPDKLEIDLAEGQNALQNVVDTMHQYAQSGAGGVMISRATDE